jgi:hypothetical protein
MRNNKRRSKVGERTDCRFRLYALRRGGPLANWRTAEHLRPARRLYPLTGKMELTRPGHESQSTGFLKALDQALAQIAGFIAIPCHGLRCHP